MREDFRNAFETELENFLNAQIPPVPFFNTENVQVQRIRDPLFVTVDYMDAYTTPGCYSGANRLKEGGLGVYIFSRAGSSRTPALVLADAIEDHLYRFDGTDFVVINVESAVDVTAGDADPLYGLMVMVDFQYAI
jgi:hypothetical protein